METEEEILETFLDKIFDQENIPIEFAEIINENFWELI